MVDAYGDLGEEPSRSIDKNPRPKKQRVVSLKLRIPLKRALNNTNSTGHDNSTASDEGDFDEEDWNSSQVATPDFSRMTERQRSRYASNDEELLALPLEGTKKKILTEEEVQLRKAETARKRKNLSERRLEEEKRDTLNKLLKKRAVKEKKVLSDANDSEGETDGVAQRPRRPQLNHPALNRWQSKQNMFLLATNNFSI